MVVVLVFSSVRFRISKENVSSTTIVFYFISNLYVCVFGRCEVDVFVKASIEYRRTAFTHVRARKLKSKMFASSLLFTTAVLLTTANAQSSIFDFSVENISGYFANGMLYVIFELTLC